MPWLWKKPSWNITAVGTREMEAFRAPIAPCTELSLAIAVDDPRQGCVHTTQATCRVDTSAASQMLALLETLRPQHVVSSSQTF
ncbi:hypothetical protein NHJ13051_000205 [Beauveria bassiana]|uniref:Uncharacterized protein n=1 Tax=Beauveria bassiana TaxID=176275 RepID=A0A2N6NEX7_BEABA|nr:hypothetical protein BM221_008042 [Beauveria bassiana]